MAKKYSQKEMENAVQLAADLYEKFYNAPLIDGGALEVANKIIDEAVKMEKWLVEKYGEDDDSYLDRLEEYEAILEKKYELPDLTKNDEGYFKITSIHRDDLEAAGFDSSQVDDTTMKRLASKMADDYLEQLFWVQLPIIAENLDIPRKDSAEKNDK